MQPFWQCEVANLKKYKNRFDQSAKGYEAISNSLGPQQTMFRAIIYKLETGKSGEPSQ